MPDLPPPPPPAQEQIATALVDCGLTRAGFAIAYDDDFRSDVVRIKVTAQTNQSQFACIRAAAAEDIVLFEDDAVERAYQTYLGDVMRLEMVESARKDLAEKGKVEGLPMLEQFSAPSDFFAAVEVHCGWKAGSVFVETAQNTWTMDPHALGNGKKWSIKSKRFDNLQCLFGSLMAQDQSLDALGLKIGFVGNAAPDAN